MSMMKSLNEGDCRSITLWPHGILFRDAEAAMRRKMIEEKHINKIYKAYNDYTDKENFAALVDTEVVLERNGNMA